MEIGLKLPTSQHTRLITDLLFQVESRAHRRGWDEHPELLVVYDATDVDTATHYQTRLYPDPGCQRGRYAARWAFSPPLLEPKPGHVVFRTALNMIRMRDQPFVHFLIENLRAPGFVGMAFQCEAWCRTPDQPGTFGDVSFAKLPGSGEMRCVTAVDLDLGYHAVARIRHEQPAPMLQHMLDGANMQALAVITACIAGRAVPAVTMQPRGWDAQAEGWGDTSPDHGQEFMREMLEREGLPVPDELAPP